MKKGEITEGKETGGGGNDLRSEHMVEDVWAEGRDWRVVLIERQRTRLNEGETGSKREMRRRRDMDSKNSVLLLHEHTQFLIYTHFPCCWLAL